MNNNKKPGKNIKDIKDIKNIKCGVIGVGYWGKFHARKYAAMDNATLCGVSDTGEDTGKEVASELNCAYYKDYHALCEEADLISVAVPAMHHHRVGCDVLKHGVSCLVEKPLAVTTEEAREMIELAKERSLILRVGYIERYNPVFIILKKLCHRPRLINVERLVPYTKRALDVNAILDLMIHDLDMVIQLMDSEITDVRGTGLHVLSDKIDTASTCLTFASGGMVNLNVNRTSLVQSRIIHVFQEDLYLIGDMKEKTLTRVTKNNNGQLIAQQEKGANNTYDALNLQLLDFVRVVREKDFRSLLPVSGEDSMSSLDVAEQMNEILKRVNS